MRDQNVFLSKAGEIKSQDSIEERDFGPIFI